MADDTKVAGKRGLLAQRQGSDRFPIPWAHDLLREALPTPKYPIDLRGSVGPGHMWGNDAEGDCVVAGFFFERLFGAARAGVKPLPVWSVSQALTLYHQLTGGPDSGLVIADALLALFQRGDIKAFAPAPHMDRLHLDSLMQLVGQPLLCGGLLYDNSEDQFNLNQVWQPLGQKPDPQMGHCMDRVYTDGVHREEWRTWASFHPATLDWSAGYLEQGEAWVVITTDEQLAKFEPQLLDILNGLPECVGGAPLPAEPVSPPPVVVTPPVVVPPVVVPPDPVVVVPPVPGPDVPPAPGPKAPGTLSIKAVHGSWRMSRVSPNSWTLLQVGVSSSEPVPLPVPSPTAWNWLLNAGQKVLGAFLVTFIPLVIAATTTQLDMPALKSAALAGVSAGLAVIDTLIGNAVAPGSVGTVHAVRWHAARTRLELAQARTHD